jgi:hypothetical protein
MYMNLHGGGGFFLCVGGVLLDEVADIDKHVLF